MALTWITVLVAALVSTVLLHRQSWTLPEPCGLKVAAVPADKLPRGGATHDFKALPKLANVTKVFEGPSLVETVGVGPDGALYAPDQHGTVWVSKDEGKTFTEFAHTGGRPLGIVLDKHNNAYLADPMKGLVMVEHDTRRVILLASRVSPESRIEPGTRISYADDLDIASDGTIYFSDASSIPPRQTVVPTTGLMDSFFLDFAQGTPKGRLLKYDPKNGQVTVLATNIWFANGVALSEDETFVVVAETVTSRLLRYWVKGPKAGTLETFVDNLPQLPDSLSRGSGSHFWVATVVAKPPAFELALRSPALRWILAWVPALRPPMDHSAMVLKVSNEGKILEALYDPTGKLKVTTAATELKGKLYLGNLAYNFVPVVKL